MFSEQASFARYFKKHTGVTPTEYRLHEGVDHSL
ncbi:MAG: helix-turn-helix domain-containing protein [Prevotella sp.]|nr:helix-turn-helix domain-containing protein [Prevotella sp.]